MRTFGPRLLVLAALLGGASPQAGAVGQSATGPIFTYHSGFWLNLHHFLYVLGRAEANFPDRTRRAVAGAPADEAQGLSRATEDERRVWREVVAAYAAGPSRRDPVFDRELIAGGEALARAGDAASLAGTAVAATLAGPLERAAPIYRRLWWEAHDQANAARWRDLEPLIRAHGPTMLGYITRVYGESWPSGGYPLQFAAWVNFAGAFSTGNRHLVIASLDEGTRGASGLEIVFHEAMHQWDDAVQARLDRAAAAVGKRIDGPLSHAMIFMTAGEAARAALPGHQTYADANGIWNGRMGAYKALLDTAWKPYLEGRGTLAEAIAAIAAGL